MSFNDGYTEELARRRAEAPTRQSISMTAKLGLSAAILATWLAHGYLTRPISNFQMELAEFAAKEQARMVSLEAMVGKCFDNGRGAVGTVTAVESSTTVRIKFDGDLVHLYRAKDLRKSPCKAPL